MAHCPAYDGTICSLCCTLDARCHDACKPGASLSEQLSSMMRIFVPRSYSFKLRTRIGGFVLRFIAIAGLTAAVFGIVYYQQTLAPGVVGETGLPVLKDALTKTFMILLVWIGIGAWWLTLTNESRHVAQEESNKQTRLLQQEIEEHRKTDAKLQQAKEIAERANQAKGRFLTGMSHELRTPLNSILGYAQLLQNDGSIPASRKQAIGIIQQSGQHLLMLINDILDVARTEAGQIKLSKIEVMFPEFLEQIVRMFRLQADNKGIAFHYQVQGSLPPVVRTDDKRLRQILINLLSNAIKFTDQGEVIFAVEYKRGTTEFLVKDTGAGIPHQDLDKIFQPFQRGPETSGRRGDGIGLGLTISRMLTELMGGEIRVKSKVGAGSTFQIKLTLPEVQAPHVISRAHNRIVSYHGRPRRILIVDDQPEHRSLLANTLLPLGFQVSEAAHGAECLRQVGTFEPDAVLMDLVMPELDGLETTRRLRMDNRTCNTVIIAVSANAFSEDREKSIIAGCNDFIPKPVRLDDLLGVLKAQLSLEWVYENINVPTPEQSKEADSMVFPPVQHLRALIEVVRIGYVKGLLEKLEQIERLDKRYAPFAGLLRRLANEFRLNEITELVNEKLENEYAST
jgi:signal transduction histidine kinase/DNA-binding NarL/FixJ family response regulator